MVFFVWNGRQQTRLCDQILTQQTEFKVLVNLKMCETLRNLLISCLCSICSNNSSCSSSVFGCYVTGNPYRIRSIMDRKIAKVVDTLYGSLVY